MKKYSTLTLAVAAACSLAACSAPQNHPATNVTLKDAFADDFLVGVAVAQPIIDLNDTAAIGLICQQFNAVSPESVLKPEYIHPSPDTWDFAPGDAYCDFAAQHGMKALGHTLMWHNQTPDFFWLNDDGSVRTDDEMRASLEEYVEKTATHFAGKVYAWDVVNEIVSEEGDYRNDKGWEKYYRGNKDDLVTLAFSTAQRCDPDAELYYNDYNMWRQTKVDGVVRLVKMLQQRGIRIDGVGIQAHWGLNYPDMKDVETTIDRLYDLGVKVMITELDIDMLPFSKEGQMTGRAMYDPALQREEFMRWLNPFPDGLPADVEQQIADRYEEVLRTIYNKRDKISRVTFWGLHDGISWKNDYPIPNRVNYPLLFNRDLSKKKAFDQVVSIAAH
ncbi:MAG: endo-1,4-beta-xylanase [Bacteroidales bacterium]|nr:endo-1,4-beta-xylanase [Bacteroidales bacterium]